MRWVSYSFREAWASLRRGGRLSLISLGSILTAFFTLGAFLVIERHVGDAAAQWADAAELSVFLDDAIDEATRTALQREIAASEVVLDVAFVSKPEALERFTREFPELGDVSASLAENPFPASLEVRLRADPRLRDASDRLAEDVKGKSGVADVRYDRQWMDNVSSLGSGVRLAGLGAVIVLIAGAALTLSAVIRLGLQARRDELEIMELVGAPATFMRGPFIVEGALLGGAGALLALVLLRFGVWAADAAGVEAITALYGTGPLQSLDLLRTLMVLAGAAAVGALAGAAATSSASSQSDSRRADN